MGIVVGALVARYLGPDQYGLLGYAASFVGLFLTLPALGTDTLAVRALVRQEYTQEVVLGTIFFMRVIASALTFLALLVVVWKWRLTVSPER
jgi:O-antigen/teichoic acid export membrane protein